MKRHRPFTECNKGPADEEEGLAGLLQFAEVDTEGHELDFLERGRGWPARRFERKRTAKHTVDSVRAPV
jgi:hypothetical protein